MRSTKYKASRSQVNDGANMNLKKHYYFTKEGLTQGKSPDFDLCVKNRFVKSSKCTSCGYSLQMLLVCPGRELTFLECLLSAELHSLEDHKTYHANQNIYERKGDINNYPGTTNCAETVPSKPEHIVQELQKHQNGNPH